VVKNRAAVIRPRRYPDQVPVDLVPATRSSSGSRPGQAAGSEVEARDCAACEARPVPDGATLPALRGIHLR
jgi:hypothetical protein